MINTNYNVQISLNCWQTLLFFQLPLIGEPYKCPLIERNQGGETHRSREKRPSLKGSNGVCNRLLTVNRRERCHILDGISIVVNRGKFVHLLHCHR